MPLDAREEYLRWLGRLAEASAQLKKLLEDKPALGVPSNMQAVVLGATNLESLGYRLSKQ